MIAIITSQKTTEKNDVGFQLYFALVGATTGVLEVTSSISFTILRWRTSVAKACRAAVTELPVDTVSGRFRKILPSI